MQARAGRLRGFGRQAAIAAARGHGPGRPADVSVPRRGRGSRSRSSRPTESKTRRRPAWTPIRPSTISPGAPSSRSTGRRSSTPPDRGEPDRAKTLGDPGPRVWETFKARYELFQVGPDGKPIAPSPWASYDGRNPCGAGFDNRVKTLASFTPYAEFNEPGFTLGEFLNPLVAQNRTYTRYEVRVNEPEYDAIAGDGWSEGRNLPDEDHPGEPADRVDRDQGVVAPDDGSGHAGGAGALLRREGRRSRRCRQEPGGRSGRLLQSRHWAGRLPYHGQDALPAPVAVEHVRAYRQRSAGRRGRSPRARRQGRRRALFLLRRRPSRTAPCPCSARPKPSRSA